MKDAVVEVFAKLSVLREWHTPAPSKGQILINTKACGVCHTDRHATRGGWPAKPAPPFMSGQEAESCKPACKRN